MLGMRKHLALALVVVLPLSALAQRLKYPHNYLYDENEQLVRIEKDTNQDGSYDQFEHYAGGKKPVRVEKDTTQDGVVDLWQFYEAAAALSAANSAGDTEYGACAASRKRGLSAVCSPSSAHNWATRADGL